MRCPASGVERRRTLPRARSGDTHDRVSDAGVALGALYALIAIPLSLVWMTAHSLDLAVGGYAAQDAIIEASGEKAAEGFTVANMIDGTNLLDNQTGLYEMLKKHDVKPAGG